MLQIVWDLATNSMKCHLTCVVLAALLVSGCDSKSSRSSTKSGPPDPDALEIVFTYGSEKQPWVEAIVGEFNQQKITAPSGKPIWVTQVPLGSGDCIGEILQNKRQPHIVSPASLAFIKLGNAESQARTGKDVVGETTNLVLSPVVIAMWKPMAEALGWPAKPVGWKELHDLAVSPQGWASRGMPQWGQFRFGHTHPEYSNSGLISLFAEVYAGTGKLRGLELADVAQPNTGDYLQEIESAVVHYGESTGFFGRKMFDEGPGYLSAAVLYENMVIEASQQAKLKMPVVAIYPKEGTFWSDHPAGIVQREWVTADHQAAARKFLDYLTARPAQEKAMALGFRPADPAIQLAAPFDEAHGVDAKQPQTTLEVPDVAVMQAITKLWQERKKKSNILLVLDTSGSMEQDGKMAAARVGAQRMISLLGDNDHVSLFPFNDKVRPSLLEADLQTNRPKVQQILGSLIAAGGTALYDAVIAARQHLQQHPQPGMISAIVVLSDGADAHSASKLDDLLQTLQANRETGGVRVFTIGYGKDAKTDVLERIANATQAKYFQGTTENIESVFRQISTFF